MNSVMVPRSLFDLSYRTTDVYFNERFPEDYTSMTENPNYTESGCGIAVTTDTTSQTIVIPNPADNTKTLCKLEYNKNSIKFIYSKPEMVNNVVMVGVGSTEKLSILNSIVTDLELLTTRKPI